MINTLQSFMSDNIGQVREDEAQQEVDRMTRQDGREWRIDKSPFMFVPDESDDRMDNPATLNEGYVWVTCSPAKYK